MSTEKLTSGTAAPATSSKARIPENQPLSVVEQDILAAMRTQYSGRLEHVSENTLVRFIRGYKDDPHPREKSLEMLGRLLTWRETDHIDELVKTTLPKGDVFKRIWPSGIHGHGKDGHPILITRVGQVDGSKLTKEFNMDEVTKFHIQEMESLDRYKDEASKLYGKRVYKHIAILDLKGLGMSHLGSKFTDPLKKFIHIDQDYYPETLHCMIIVNGGFFVKTAWKLASGMMDPITKERIKFGNQHLVDYIDAGNIPHIYGGACKCQGGKCLEVPFEEGDKSAKVAIQGEKSDMSE